MSRRRWPLTIALLAALALGLQPGRAPAFAAGTTRYVATTGTDSGGCSLSTSPCKTIAYALSQAASGDTVSLAGGTYAGGFTIGQSITLTGVGVGATIISGGGPVATVTAGTTVTITGVTITGGNSTTGSGGGIENAGTLTVNSSTISGNTATGNGGGLDQPSGSITLNNTTVTGNSASGDGGAIGNGGTLTVNNSTLSGNRSQGAGGIFSIGPVTLTNSTLVDNRATSYGGGVVAYGSTYVMNSTVSGNTSGVGGGIYTFATLVVDNSTINGNSAPQGGALNIYSGTVSVVNSTLAGNIVTGVGGAIALGGATLDLTNDTISENTAGTGGGIGGGAATLSNTIIAGNTVAAGGSGPDCASTLSDGPGGHNLIGNSSGGCTVSGLTKGDQVGTGAAPLDPQLMQLGYNGGPTETMLLQPGSPAHGAGDPSTCAAATLTVGGVSVAGPNDQDQRGNPRSSTARGACDIGATDLSRLWYVAPSGSNSSSCTSSSAPCLTIGPSTGALSKAGNGDTISLAPGTYSGPDNAGITIPKSVTLLGAGATQTTISGGGAVLTSATGTTVSIEGVTLTQGKAGGVTANGTTVISHSAITGNTGTLGGGVGVNAPTTLFASTVSGNRSSSSGGGVFSGPGKPVTIIDSTLSANVTGVSGGGVASQGATSVISSTIVANTAHGDGGGILSFGSSSIVTVGASVLTGNAAAAGPDCYATLRDGGHNFIGNNSACGGALNGVNGDQVGTAASPLDPRLSLLDYHGGQTQTMLPRADSLLHNAGDPGTCAEQGDTDQRGNPRNSLARGACDIGAADLATVWYAGPGGNDGNTCSSVSAACQSVAGALTKAGNGDTIDLLAGTYTGGITVGKSVTLLGASAGSTTISGGGPVVTISAGITVAMIGVAIGNGNNTSGDGGGILNHGTLTLSNGALTNNKATGDGGGIWSDGSLVVSTTSITTSSAAHGAGIRNLGPLYVTGTTLSVNQASINGGGIDVYSGIATVSNSTFSQNAASSSGGGLGANNLATVTVIASTFDHNAATGSGGGIFDYGAALLLSGSTVSYNTAGSGGGVLGNGGLTAVNSTFVGNQTQSTSSNGGGLWLDNGNNTIINSTISGNSSGDGGGLLVANYPGTSVTLSNSIVAGNTGNVTGGAPDCSDSVGQHLVDGGHNLIGNGTGCPKESNGTNGDLVGVANPGLTALGSYGGPTKAEALLPGSPAIGAGSSAICNAAPVASVDQRGTRRPSASCDIGAYDTAEPSLMNPAAPTTTTAGTSFNLTVTLQKPDGSTATGYTGTVTFTSSDPQAVLPAGYTFTAADAGTHTFAVTLKTAGNQTVTVSDGVLTGTSGVTVSAGAAASLVLGAPASAKAGVGLPLTVTAKDAYGNTATGYTGTVHFTSTDAHASLPGDYTFTVADNGSHAFAATLSASGAQTITATDVATASIKGSASITVGTGSAASLALSPSTGMPAAGTAFTLTVTARDGAGNTVTGYSGTVHVTSSDGQAALPADYTFTPADAGTHTFSLTLKTSGSQTITVGDGTLSANSSVTVSPAAVSALALSAPASATAGTSFPLTVTAKDTYGNTVPGYTGTVHFSSSDTHASVPADYTFIAADNGSHTFTATLTATGAQTVTATDTTTGSITGNASVTVDGGAAARLLLSPATTGPTPGSSFDLAVTVQDAAGNTVTGYTGTVHLTSTDGSASLPTDYTFTAADAGAHTFSVTLNTPGNQTITATDTATSSISGSVLVSVGGTGVTVQAGAGWNLVGGYPLTVWKDATAAWTYSAATGQWAHPNGQEPVGAGAWEQVPSAGPRSVVAETCSSPVTVQVIPHRWNLVGNPCSVAVAIPAGDRALGYSTSKSAYAVVTSIEAGGAVWLLPSANSIQLGAATNAPVPKP